MVRGLAVARLSLGLLLTDACEVDDSMTQMVQTVAPVAMAKRKVPRHWLRSGTTCAARIRAVCPGSPVRDQQSSSSSGAFPPEASLQPAGAIHQPPGWLLHPHLRLVACFAFINPHAIPWSCALGPCLEQALLPPPATCFISICRWL